MMVDKTNFDAAIDRLRKEGSYGAYSAVSNLLAKKSAGSFGLHPLRIAILRNFSIEPVIPVIVGELALAGLHAQIYLGEFDAISNDVLDPQSELYTFDPEVIILGYWLETLAPRFVNRFLSIPSDALDSEIQDINDRVMAVVSKLRKQTGAPILVNNFPLLHRATLGALDAQGGGQTQALFDLNRSLQREAKNRSDVYVVDYFSAMSFTGANEGFDERYWHMGRAPIGSKLLVPLGCEYSALIRSLRGRSRKCLVLDCDNTLWGGVVGEDGLEGIRLGVTHPGSCYMSFQKEILNLHDRGVILTLCSKNNEQDVLEVLRNHPDMVLRENHLAAWQINWDDKATNIQRLAQDLNIGLDSMVFVDDSRFECDLVRSRLPEVTVVHLPSQPFHLRRVLTQGGFFDSLSFSAEDSQRNQMYGGEFRRKALMKASSSIEEYLQELELVAEIGVPTKFEVPRVSQLTQKTNQFNLTTIRYTESQIQAFLDDPNYDVFFLKLKDKVDDLGLISTAIIKYENRGALIDSFLMSCRAIGRGVEEALLSFILRQCQMRLKGVEGARVTGRYVPTAKNQQVAEFYSKAGFLPLENSTTGSVWVWDLENEAKPFPSWIEILGIGHSS